MDTDGFPLATISEKSNTDNNTTAIKPKKRGKESPLRPADSNDGRENGGISSSKFNQPATLETSVHSERPMETTPPNIRQTTTRGKPYKITSVPDEGDNNRREENIKSKRPSLLMSENDKTMVSTYPTGGSANDEIEIHQFSSVDIDAYINIYFETLDNRLRHYIGQDEQLQQFRAAMKTRLNSNPNAREYQNVYLGKMNGEVLAAVTMSFAGETSTIPDIPDVPEQTCLTSIRRWMTRKSNYIPTSGDECYIEMIGVKSNYRNHGIGSAMLDCVEHFARQAGAHRLTIHTNGQQLRNYFERFGFTVDHTDSSSFWKWVIERQSADKLSKDLLLNEDNIDYTTGSYINESIIDE